MITSTINKKTIVTLNDEEYNFGKERGIRIRNASKVGMKTNKFDSKISDMDIQIQGALYEYSSCLYLKGELLSYREKSGMDRGYDIIIPSGNNSYKVEVTGIKSENYFPIMTDMKWRRIKDKADMVWFVCPYGSNSKCFRMLGGLWIKDFDKLKRHEGPDTMPSLKYDNWAIDSKDLYQWGDGFFIRRIK